MASLQTNQDEDDIQEITNNDIVGEVPKRESHHLNNEVLVSKRYRYIKSLALSTIWLSFGLVTAVVNPTIIDLKELMNCNYEEITRVMVAKSGGMILGSIIGGALADRYRTKIDVIMGMELFLLGAGTIAIPFMPNLWAMGSAFFMQGLAFTALSAGGNSLVLSLWGKNANAPVQAIHMMYGVGTIVAPLIAAPFLPIEHQNETLHSHNEDMLDLFKSQSNNITLPSIFIPYSVCGGVPILSSVLFFIFGFCTKTPQLQNDETPEKKSWTSLFSPKSCGGSTAYGLIMLLGLAVVYIAILGKDVSFGTFLVPLAVEGKLHFSKKMAAYINTAYFASYTLSRLVTSVVGIWCRVQWMIFVEIIGNLIVVVLLLVLGFESKVIFWVLTCLFGFFAGPIYPHGMVWADQYLNMTAMGIAVIDLGISLGSLVMPWLSGYLYQYKDKIDVIYISLINAAILLIVLGVLQLIGTIHGGKYKSKKENSDTEPLVT